MKTTFPKMHVSLYVKSIAETTKFYSAFFGKEADKIERNYAKYILDEPALIISFIENPSKVQSNFGHLGFQVDSIEELNKRLKDAEKNKQVESQEIGTACCYAVQDKFWLRDPDGYAWEVYYFHSDVKFNDPHHELVVEESCCASESSGVKSKCC